MLTADTLSNVINRAVLGGFSPVALLLNDAEIEKFVCRYSRQLASQLHNADEMELRIKVASVLAHWVPLVLTEQEDRTRVPLYKLIYLHDQHYPTNKAPDLVATPSLTINGLPIAPQTVFHHGRVDMEARARLMIDITDKIQGLFEDRTGILARVAQGLPLNIYYHPNGARDTGRFLLYRNIVTITNFSLPLSSLQAPLPVRMAGLTSRMRTKPRWPPRVFSSTRTRKSSRR